MKTNLILLSLLLGTFSSALGQLPVDEKNGEITYSEIVQLEGMAKEDIYQKAKFWMVSTLKSGDNMVELDGSTTDKIVGTGNIELQLNPDNNKTKDKLYLNKGYLNFKFIVFCKEGRLKYEVKNFRLLFDRTNYNYMDISSNVENLNEMDIPGLGKNQQILFKEYAIEAVDRNLKVLIKDFLVNIKANDEDSW